MTNRSRFALIEWACYVLGFALVAASFVFDNWNESAIVIVAVAVMAVPGCAQELDDLTNAPPSS